MVKRVSRWLSLGPVLVAIAAGPATAAPPFTGTIFLDPDIITPEDATAFVSLQSTGRGSRLMFDRRIPGWTTLNAFLFEARFSDGDAIEIQVNPEFGEVAAARVAAEEYAPPIGRLPLALRRDVETVWIHRGFNPFGGGNNNLLIHTGQGERYLRDGILEETLVHEASHTSLDNPHATTRGWLGAQAADGEFISTYARDNPTREDIAESFLTYLAVRHRADRISSNLAETILRTIPNRLAYFDSLALDLHPMVPRQPPAIIRLQLDPDLKRLTVRWASRPGTRYALFRSLDLDAWEAVGGTIPSAGERTEHSWDWTEALPQAFFQVRESP